MVLPLNVTTLLRIFLMCVFGVIAITGCSSSSGADETGSDFVELELKLTKDVKLQAREMLRFLTTDETDFTTIASFSPSECPFNAGEFLMGMSLVKSMVDTGGDWDVEITSIEFLSDQTALVETVMLKDGQPFSWNDKQTRGSKELWVLQDEKWRATTGCDTYEAQMNLINLRDAKIVLIGERFPIGSIHVTVEDFWVTKTPPRSTDPSPKGVYLVVKYRFENTGTQPVSPWGNLSLKLYDESGRTWDGAAMSILDVGPGLSGTFEADWDVPSNLSSFLLELKPGHSSSADGEQSTIVRLADEKTALKEATTASTPDPTSSPSTTPKASTPTTTATVTPSPSATPTPTSNPPTAATPTATVTQTPTNTPTATPTKAKPRVWSSNKQLILERGWGCSNSAYGNYIYTEGQVTNNTSRSLKYLKAYVSMMAGDTFVTSDFTYVDFTTLLPGQSSAFKIITDGNPAITSCKISFQDEDGYVSYEKRPEPTPVPTPPPTPTPTPVPTPPPTPTPTPVPTPPPTPEPPLATICDPEDLPDGVQAVNLSVGPKNTPIGGYISSYTISGAFINSSDYKYPNATVKFTLYADSDCLGEPLRTIHSTDPDFDGFLSANYPGLDDDLWTPFFLRTLSMNYKSVKVSLENTEIKKTAVGENLLEILTVYGYQSKPASVISTKICSESIKGFEYEGRVGYSLYGRTRSGNYADKDTLIYVALMDTFDESGKILWLIQLTGKRPETKDTLSFQTFSADGCRPGEKLDEPGNYWSWDPSKWLYKVGVRSFPK